MTKEELKQLLTGLIKQTKDLHYLFINMISTKEDYKKFGKEEKEILKKYENRTFESEYQAWYSKSCIIIKRFLPDRIDEFIDQYLPQRNRKIFNASTYTISDAICGYSNSSVKPISSHSKLMIQFEILKSVDSLINSKINDIVEMLEFNVFEKEIESARKLHKNKYYRAAGAICGVILEKHLLNLLNKNNLKNSKKDPSINDLNQLLYNENIFDSTKYKFLIYLGDIRNKCDHNKTNDPTKEEVMELIEGTEKVIKTYY